MDRRFQVVIEFVRSGHHLLRMNPPGVGLVPAFAGTIGHPVFRGGKTWTFARLSLAPASENGFRSPLVFLLRAVSVDGGDAASPWGAAVRQAFSWWISVSGSTTRASLMGTVKLPPG